MTSFDRELLDALANEGWLRVKPHPDAQLWIYNYTERTQFENHWTPETLACRGLILDANGQVVARPFGKFFNYGDPKVGAIPAGESFQVTEKIDGSLGILYYLDGEPYIATRGSFDSEQAIEGTAMIREHDVGYREGVTPLFEIVYPSNRIVVDYGERRELVLLTAIDHETGRDVARPTYSGRTVQHYGQVPLEQLAGHEKPNREGFVVSFESGLRVKVKFAEYVRLHKIVTGLNKRGVWEALKNEDDLDALIDGVPDELHAWVQATRGELLAAFNGVWEAADATFRARPETDDRRTLAEYFLGSGSNSAVLFRMLDEKPYGDLIWKAIRPEPETPECAPSELAA